MWHVHLDHVGAGGLQRSHRVPDARLHTRFHTRHEVLPRQSQPQALQCRRSLIVVLVKLGGEVGHIQRRRGRVALVVAGDRRQQQCRVPRVTSQGTDLVER